MSYVTLDRYSPAQIKPPLTALVGVGQATASMEASPTRVFLAEVLYLGLVGAGLGAASSWYARGSVSRGALAGSVVTLGLGLVASLFAP
jgi:hypothetical protein